MSDGNTQNQQPHIFMSHNALEEAPAPSGPVQTLAPVDVTSEQRVPVRSPDGQVGTIPIESLSDAVKGGFKGITDAEYAAAKDMEAHPVKYAIRSAVQGADEVIGGAGFAIANALSPLSEEQKIRDTQLEATHPTAHMAGKVGTHVAIAALTAGAGSAVEGAVAGRTALGVGMAALEREGLTTLASELAPGAGRAVAGAVARGAVEGTLQEAPRALRQAYDGNPDLAAETLLWGAGGGAVLGGVFGVAGQALKKGARFAEGAVGKAAARLESEMPVSQPESLGREAVLETGEGSAQYVTKEAFKEASPEAVAAARAGFAAKKVGELAGGAAGKVAKGVAGGVGESIGHATTPGLGGVIGLQLGEGAKKTVEGWTKRAVTKWADGFFQGPGAKYVGKEFLTSLAEDPHSLGLGAALARAGDGVLGQSLSTVPGIISGMAAEHQVEYEPRGRKSDRKTFDEHAAALRDLVNNPDRLLEVTGHVTGLIGHDESTAKVGDAMQQAALRQVDYLFNNLPKDPNPPAPWTTSQWKPSDADINAYNRKLEVAVNPLSVITHLKDGSLTKEHVDALDALYPNTAETLRKAVLESATLGNAPTNLSRAAKVKLSVLLRAPVDPSMRPDRFAATQALYNKGSEKGGESSMLSPGSPPSGAEKKINIKDIPAAESSTVGRLSR